MADVHFDLSEQVEQSVVMCGGNATVNGAK
jgi:hypothetical protein